MENEVKRQFRTIDTLFTIPIWNEETVPLQRVKVATKRQTGVVSLVLCIFLMVISGAVGIGMGKTIMAGQSNMIRYCAGGTCTLQYHDACSDWIENQHDGSTP